MVARAGGVKLGANTGQRRKQLLARLKVEQDEKKRAVILAQLQSRVLR